jgi:hypothetical protein
MDSHCVIKIASLIQALYQLIDLDCDNGQYYSATESTLWHFVNTWLNLWLCGLLQVHYGNPPYRCIELDELFQVKQINTLYLLYSCVLYVLEMRQINCGHSVVKWKENKHRSPLFQKVNTTTNSRKLNCRFEATVFSNKLTILPTLFICCCTHTSQARVRYK